MWLLHWPQGQRDPRAPHAWHVHTPRPTAQPLLPTDTRSWMPDGPATMLPIRGVPITAQWRGTKGCAVPLLPTSTQASFFKVH